MRRRNHERGPVTCLCGCKANLPPGYEFFATNECVERWLERHGGAMGRGQKADPVDPQGICPSCGESRALRDDGTLRAHRVLEKDPKRPGRRGVARVRCGGEGKVPIPCLTPVGDSGNPGKFSMSPAS